MRFNFLLFCILGVALGSCGSVDLGNQDPLAYDPTSISPNTCSGVSAGFAANVSPIFLNRGCSGCHTATNPAGNLNLDVGGSSLGAVYTEVSDPKEVNTTIPRNSLLLRKSINVASHGGGRVFSSILDTDYITIFCWIAAGAQNN
jgi:hypothetical protein